MIAEQPPTGQRRASPTGTAWLDQEGSSAWAVAALFAFALIVGAYFVFRFGGRWSEGDTANLATAIRAVSRSQTLLPPDGGHYPNGYGFSAVSAFVVAATGLDVATLLQLVYPMVSASLVVIAWPLYRELTASGRGATLATLLLFLQPEFLFVILRGSHERVLRALLFLSLWLLIRSLRYAEHTRAYAIYVGLFYLAAYGVIATNSFFGSSYVAALGVALACSWLAGFLGPGLGEVSALTRRRLIYAPIFCTVLAFLFNGYIYPTAGASLSQVSDIFGRLQQIFLTASPETTQGQATADYDPYAVVAGQWIDLRIYFLISISTYALMLASAIVWVRTGLRWLARSTAPPTAGEWLLWLFYAAFAVQGALSIVADRAGTLGGNLQYRSFPSFAMVAAPMVALALARWQPRPRLRPLLAGGLGLLTLFAVAKATNEPSISNKWTFYLPAEVAAIEWIEAHVTDPGYWSDFDERLGSVAQLLDKSTLITFLSPNYPQLRVFLTSDVTRHRAARLRRPFPPIGGELRIYDNGSAQVYRLRPRTPYQE